MFDTLTKADLKRLHKEINNHVDDAAATAAFRTVVGALMAEEIGKRKDEPLPVVAAEHEAEKPSEHEPKPYQAPFSGSPPEHGGGPFHAEIIPEPHP
jgi:hypothetical protein